MKPAGIDDFSDIWAAADALRKPSSIQNGLGNVVASSHRFGAALPHADAALFAVVRRRVEKAFLSEDVTWPIIVKPYSGAAYAKLK